MRLILIALLLLGANNSFGQKAKKSIYDRKIPKNLEQCIEILDETLPEEERALLLEYPEDSIRSHNDFKYGIDFYHVWEIHDGSRITRYFNKKGLFGTNEIYTTILTSYHRHLHNQPIHLDEQISAQMKEQQKERDKYIERTKKDSINGVYIPINLEECFQSLDQLLKAEDIATIKNLPARDDVIQYHHGFGTWLRNNWGLWGGSRLQQYFLKKGIQHPDDMSHTILLYYYDWLNEEHVGWQEFEKG